MNTRDRGSISVVMMFLLVLVLAGAGLVVDGGRAMFCAATRVERR